MTPYELAVHIANLLDGTGWPDIEGLITAWVEGETLVVEHYSDEDIFQVKFVLPVTMPETA